MTTKTRTKTDKQALERERQLIDEARDNPHAFGKLFDRYHDDIYSYILHRTANVALAQELTSDTFFKALNKLWMFQWKGVPFSAWLFRIASNEVNGYFRKYKHYRTRRIEDYEDLLIDELSDADREMLEAEAKLAEDVIFVELHRSIATLKPRYQEVITLRFFENKKLVEIANILGKSEGTIKSLLHRAVAKLREKIALPE